MMIGNSKREKNEKEKYKNKSDKRRISLTFG